MRTYPGYAGNDFSWDLNSAGELMLSIHPTQLEYDDVAGSEFDLDYFNFAFVPWFESMAEPTGNAAEDSSRARFLWLQLVSAIAEAADSREEAMFCRLL
jgi:hypothetical protein